MSTCKPILWNLVLTCRRLCLLQLATDSLQCFVGLLQVVINIVRRLIDRRSLAIECIFGGLDGIFGLNAAIYK